MLHRSGFLFVAVLPAYFATSEDTIRPMQLCLFSTLTMLTLWSCICLPRLHRLYQEQRQTRRCSNATSGSNVTILASFRRRHGSSARRRAAEQAQAQAGTGHVGNANVSCNCETRPSSALDTHVTSSAFLPPVDNAASTTLKQSSETLATMIDANPPLNVHGDGSVTDRVVFQCSSELCDSDDALTNIPVIDGGGKQPTTTGDKNETSGGEEQVSTRPTPLPPPFVTRERRQSSCPVGSLDFISPNSNSLDISLSSRASRRSFSALELGASQQSKKSPLTLWEALKDWAGFGKVAPMAKPPPDPDSEQLPLSPVSENTVC